MPPGPWHATPVLEPELLELVDVEDEVCAPAERMDGEARRIAMIATVDAVTIAVFMNLVVIFKSSETVGDI